MRAGLFHLLVNLVLTLSRGRKASIIYLQIPDCFTRKGESSRSERVNADNFVSARDLFQNVKGTFCRFKKVGGHMPQMPPRFLRL